MEPAVYSQGDRFVLAIAGSPVRTPLGTLVTSRYAELLHEAAAEIRHLGTDPKIATSMFSLQVSYLDYGLASSREELVDSIISGLEDDPLCRPPEDSLLAQGLSQVFGGPARDEMAFRAALESLARRALIGVVMAGGDLGSGLAGLEVLRGEVPVAPAARALCQYRRALRPALRPSPPASSSGEASLAAILSPAGRCRVPCRSPGPVSCSRNQRPEAARGLVGDHPCEVAVVLDKILRFSRFGEERP